MSRSLVSLRVLVPAFGLAVVAPSLPASAHWTEIGNGIWSPDAGNAEGQHHQCGRVIQVAWRMDQQQGESVLWAGAAYGGVWKSLLGSDGNIESWIPLTDNFPAPHAMGSFLVHRLDSDRILVGPGGLSSGDGDGRIYRTDDQGATWTPVALPLDTREGTIKRINRLVEDRSDPTGNTVFAATSHGIFRTINFGLRWRRVFRKVQISDQRYNEVTDIVQDTGTPTTWYAGALIDHAIIRSTGSGDWGTWKKHFGDKKNRIEGSVGRVSLAVTDADPSVIYALISKAADAANNPKGFNALYRTMTSGDDWTKIFGRTEDEHDAVDALNQGTHTNAIGCDPNDSGHIFFGLAQALEALNATAPDPDDINWKGIDEDGKIERSTLDGGHFDYNFVLFRPGYDDIVLANDGGYYVYDPDTQTVDDSGNLLGMNVTWLRRSQGTLASSRSKPDLFIAGTQDNGLVRGFSDAGVIELMQPGDGGQVSIKPTDAAVMAASSTVFEDGGHRAVSFDYGLIWSDVTMGLDDSTSSSMQIDPTPGLSDPLLFTSSQVPAGLSRIHYRPLDVTSIWAQASGWTVLGEIAHLDHATEPALHQIVVTIKGSRKAYVYTDVQANLGNLSLFDNTPPLPALTSATEDAHANADRSELQPQTLYYTTATSRPSRAFFSRYGGQTWEDITGDLPTDVDLNKLIGNPENSTQFFIATSKGVYRTDLAGLHWYLYSEGLRVDEEIQDIVINTHGLAEPTLFIGTKGRGFWQRVIE